MGFPVWKREIRDPLIAIASKLGDKIGFKTFATWYLRSYLRFDDVTMRQKKGLLNRAKKIFNQVVADKKAMGISDIYNNALLQSVFREMAVEAEGGLVVQELDTVNSKYNLLGNTDSTHTCKVGEDTAACSKPPG